MLILRWDQTRVSFDDLDWHGVSDRFLNLESWSAEMSISPFWDRAGCWVLSPASVTEWVPGKDPASPSRPKEEADVCYQSPQSTTPPSPGSSIVLQYSSDLLAVPSRQPRASIAGWSTPPRPHFRAPTPSSSSPHTCPTDFSLDSFGGFLSGALLLLSFLPWVPLPTTDLSTSEVTCRPSLQGPYVDTTCSSQIPITAITHSGLSSGQKHIPPQMTLTRTPVLNPPRPQASWGQELCVHLSDLVPASSPESSTVLGTQKALSKSGNKQDRKLDKQDEGRMTFKVVSVLSEAELRNHASLGANQL